MNREECLKKSMEIVNGERQTNYGKPEDNFKRIARLWEVYLQNREQEYLDIINKEDVAIMMLLVKVARLMNNPSHTDSWVDICGYAACGCEMTTEVKIHEGFVFKLGSTIPTEEKDLPKGTTKQYTSSFVFPDIDKMFENFGVKDKPKQKKKKGKKNGV